MREWFTVEAAQRGGGDITIYGRIGRDSLVGDDAVDARSLVAEIDRLAKAGPGDITVHISSPGGVVSEGIAIYNALRRHKNRVVCVIEGIAYSMASVIALAGREVRMFDNATLMVHYPRGGASGTAEDFQRAIQSLETAAGILLQAYTAKTGKPQAEIEALMNQASILTAAQAKELGFVDTILGDQEMPIAACDEDPQAWASYFQGKAPLPVVAVAEQSKASAPTVAQLRNACPGASDGFLLRHIELGSTVADASRAWLAKLDDENKAMRAELDRLTRPQAKAPGVKPLGTGGGEDTEPCDPVSTWNAEISRRVKAGMPRHKAVSDLVRHSPLLHAEYIEAVNLNRGR